jgi:hypothetical protein
MTLETYIHENTTVTAFAALIGKSRAQVHRYMRGENLTKAIIDEIVDVTGGQVTAASFFDPPAAAVASPTDQPSERENAGRAA